MHSTGSGPAAESPKSIHAAAACRSRALLLRQARHTVWKRQIQQQSAPIRLLDWTENPICQRSACANGASSSLSNAALLFLLLALSAAGCCGSRLRALADF
ncbi:uncharacterized protein TrAFT101_002923 [Trichoderma asperellum]|uniref:uncharacterized protein n=1 Tax=Trichoderma asperellum TaxID=101201 RepID=UPI00331E872C|nr:hypothetical protein TrAFT101_002923 [Trichoderma asperellum]